MESQEEAFLAKFPSWILEKNAPRFDTFHVLTQGGIVKNPTRNQGGPQCHGMDPRQPRCMNSQAIAM